MTYTIVVEPPNFCALRLAFEMPQAEGVVVAVVIMVSSYFSKLDLPGYKIQQTESNFRRQLIQALRRDPKTVARAVLCVHKKNLTDQYFFL